MNPAMVASIVEMGGEATLQRIAEEMEAVETELQAQLQSYVPLVREVGEHTLSAGGKRLRPALVTLTAAATGLDFDTARTRKLGACMELIHMATLIHDDVIDRADLRRGVPTAASRFGNTAAILSGDVMLAKAMRILALDGDLEVIRLVSSIVVDLAEGEVLELAVRGRLDLSETEHRDVLRMKTATFIQACCDVGAACAQADPAVREAVRTFGFNIGLAFQIVDDLLDYRGDHVATGKLQATDFREGCATLPLIYLIPTLAPGELEMVRSKFGNGVTDAEIQMISEWMDGRGAYAKTQAAAQTHIDDAIRALDALPDSGERRLLSGVAEFIVARKA